MFTDLLNTSISTYDIDNCVKRLTFNTIGM